MGRTGSGVGAVGPDLGHAGLLRGLDYRIELDDGPLTARWGDPLEVRGRVALASGVAVPSRDGAGRTIRVGGRISDPRTGMPIKEVRGDLAAPVIGPGAPAPFVMRIEPGFLAPERCAIEINLVVDHLGWFAGPPLRTTFELLPDPRFVDVRALIAEVGVDGLCRTAEEYFASTPDEPWHRTKPYALSYAMHGFPQFGFMVRGLALAEGMTVVDFGSGTGWAARALNAMGLEVIAVDVSRAALDISEELYRGMPRHRPLPPMRFVHFDGHSLAPAIPDESVDRVFVMDALHHVPNLAEVLAELARILRPGGVAGFCEAGERHAINPHAQAVMRRYRVLENSIDMFEIERIGARHGLADLRVMIQNAMPDTIPLEQYRGFKAGSVQAARYVAATLERMKHCQMFFMTKGA